jgi:hypothetical protein
MSTSITLMFGTTDRNSRDRGGEMAVVVVWRAGKLKLSTIDAIFSDPDQPFHSRSTMAKSHFCSRNGRKLRWPVIDPSDAMGTGDLWRMSARAGASGHVHFQPGDVELLIAGDPDSPRT